MQQQHALHQKQRRGLPHSRHPCHTPSTNPLPPLVPPQFGCSALVKVIIYSSIAEECSASCQERGSLALLQRTFRPNLPFIRPLFVCPGAGMDSGLWTVDCGLSVNKFSKASRLLGLRFCLPRLVDTDTGGGGRTVGGGRRDSGLQQ